MSLTALICNPAFGFAGRWLPFDRDGRVSAPLGRCAAAALVYADTLRPGRARTAAGVLRATLAGAWRSGRSDFLRSAGCVFALSPERRLRVPPRRRRRATLFLAPGVGTAMFAEMRRVLNDRGVLGLIVLAPLIYGALYPQPYLGQVLRHIPIAVVDQDHTELSRNLVQSLNADEATAVAVRSDTLAEAQAALARREVFAILGIPQDTEKEVLKGNHARLAAYVDSAYFLLYNRMLQGISEASGVGQRRCRIERRARRRRPRPCRFDQKLARRNSQRAAVQPDRRLCELCGSGRFHSYPATNIAAGRRDDGRGVVRIRATAGARRGSRHSRPGDRAFVPLLAGACALPDHHCLVCSAFRHWAGCSTCWRWPSLSSCR